MRTVRAVCNARVRGAPPTARGAGGGERFDRLGRGRLVGGRAVAVVGARGLGSAVLVGAGVDLGRIAVGRFGGFGAILGRRAVIALRLRPVRRGLLLRLVAATSALAAAAAPRAPAAALREVAEPLPGERGRLARHARAPAP